MNDTSKVSVVTSFFNAEKYLYQAVESVFRQTHTNWELLLVDDGSTDASTQLALELAERFPIASDIFNMKDILIAVYQLPQPSDGRSASNYVALLMPTTCVARKLEEQLAILDSSRRRLGVRANRIFPDRRGQWT